MAAPTTQEIFERQRREKRLSERSKTIVAELRLLEPTIPITGEAVEVIEWLQQKVGRLESDLRDEIREGQRSAGAAYAQGQQDEREESKWR